MISIVQKPPETHPCDDADLQCFRLRGCLALVVHADAVRATVPDLRNCARGLRQSVSKRNEPRKQSIHRGAFVCQRDVNESRLGRLDLLGIFVASRLQLETVATACYF